MRPSLTLTALFVGTLGWLGGLSSAVRADDRDLLRQGAGDPYVFIIFDTSRSMNRSSKCSLADWSRPAGDPLKCDFLCPDGDCYVPLQGDDPESKLYQAKEALYSVLQSTTNLHVGFATFNQDRLEARSKHWLYRVAQRDGNGNANSGIALLSGQVFPQVGAEEVFGRTWACGNGNGFASAGCSAGNPADLVAPEELHRMQRCGQPNLQSDLHSDQQSQVWRCQIPSQSRSAALHQQQLQPEQPGGQQEHLL
jgi:hypothetical protein